MKPAKGSPERGGASFPDDCERIMDASLYIVLPVLATCRFMKTVLLTGCSTGFGRAAAAHFSARDWNVVATMRNPKAEGAPKPSDRLRVVSLDVTDRRSIDLALEEGFRAFGGIDAVVNNAGIGLLSAFEVTPERTMRELFETNTFGVMSVCQAIIPHFRERRAGTLVNVTSSVGLLPMGLVSVYTASKFAVEGFTESLAYELAAFGIRTKIVEPGYAPTTAFTASGLERMKDLISPPYMPYAEQIFGGHANAQHTKESDVADAIFRAVTDESDRLRYPAGADSVALAALREGFPGERYLEEVRPMLWPREVAPRL